MMPSQRSTLARRELERPSVTNNLGFRRVLKNNRQDKLKTKLMKIRSPRKSVQHQNDRFQSPGEKENKPQDTIQNQRSSSGKKRRHTPRKASSTLITEVPKKTLIYAVPSDSDAGGKRKRKTERQLSILQNELRGSNLLWSREKIIEIAEKTGMSETQIYKWWWDQTRKRVKRLKINNQLS